MHINEPHRFVYEDALKNIRVLQWTITTHLTDLEYADDIYLLAQSYSDKQELNDRQPKNCSQSLWIYQKHIEDPIN